MNRSYQNLIQDVCPLTKWILDISILFTDTIINEYSQHDVNHLLFIIKSNTSNSEDDQSILKKLNHSHHHLFDRIWSSLLEINIYNRSIIENNIKNENFWRGENFDSVILLSSKQRHSLNHIKEYDTTNRYLSQTFNFISMSIRYIWLWSRKNWWLH